MPNMSFEDRKIKVFKVLDYLEAHWEEWYLTRERQPLAFMPHLSTLYSTLHPGEVLPGLAEGKTWIKAGSYQHRSLIINGQLDQCPHLKGSKDPSPNLMAPSYCALQSF